MGRTSKGTLDNASGTVGTVVGAKWRGQALYEAPFFVRRPKAYCYTRV